MGHDFSAGMGWIVSVGYWEKMCIKQVGLARHLSPDTMNLIFNMLTLKLWIILNVNLCNETQVKIFHLLLFSDRLLNLFYKPVLDSDTVYALSHCKPYINSVRKAFLPEVLG
jgi:hypothetical protein